MEEKSYSNKTVIFVDDEANVLSSLRRELRKEGYKKFFTTDIDEVFSLLENNEIHVVVTDMRMPIMTGLELLREVRKKYPDIIRIVLSGYTQITTILSAINSGDIFKYITKPWDAENNLIPSIREALNVYDEKKEKENEVTELESKLKAMKEGYRESGGFGTENSTSIDMDKYDNTISMALDYSANIKETLDNLNEMLLSYHSSMSVKVKPFMTKAKYELERFEQFCNIISKNLDRSETSINLNNYFFKIIERYTQYLNKFRIKINFTQSDNLEIISNKWLLIFVIEDILKRVIIFGICNEINIQFLISGRNQVVLIRLNLNLKYEMYEADLENIFGKYFMDYYAKSSDIDVKILPKDGMCNIILDFGEQK